MATTTAVEAPLTARWATLMWLLAIGAGHGQPAWGEVRAVFLRGNLRPHGMRPGANGQHGNAVTLPAACGVDVGQGFLNFVKTAAAERKASR